MDCNQGSEPAEEAPEAASAVSGAFPTSLFAPDSEWEWRKRQLPLVNEREAEVFREFGWVEDRDFWVSPDLPSDYRGVT